jgi:hypothetical protein
MNPQITKDNLDHYLMTLQHERRINPREPVDKHIKYRLVNMDTFEDCRLHNLSRDGALISTTRRLPLHSRVHLAIKPDNDAGFSIQIIATVVRNANKENVDGYFFKYGCHFEYVNDPN